MAQAQVTELVEELSKKKPNQRKVKHLMNQLGIGYTPNLIDQMSTVLNHFDLLLSAKRAHNKERDQEL